MDNEIFYEDKSSQYGDGILLDEYRGEFSLVAAKRKDGKVFMEWVFPQKRDGSKEPIDKSLPWKIKLGDKDAAIEALRFFIAELTGEKEEAPGREEPREGEPSDDDIPF